MARTVNSLCWVAAIAAVAWTGSVAAQQRVRLPQAPVTLEPAPTSTSSNGATLVPVTPPPGAGASATMGAPAFDPYATTPNPTSAPPVLGSQPPAWTGTPPAVQPPPASSPTPYLSPAPYSSPGSVPPAVTPPATGTPYFGSEQPPVLIPGSQGFGLPPVNWPQPQQGRYMRFFQEIRVQETWLYGKDAVDQMQTHDIEFAATVNFPNFLWSGMPLHVSPIFDLSLWDGPDDADLPPQVYGALLDLAWEPMITPQFGADLNVSVGVFSDFNSVTQDSLRIQGTGLAILNLTPTMTLKGGAEYLDRVKYHWLPAGGVLWQPNPRVRWDIYFPRPKLSQYLTTIGNADVWWYLAGEYGGGTWTVERFGVGDDTRMDINDYRVGLGFDWRCQSGSRGFFEVAYVFGRKLVYATGPIESQSLKDTVMLRGGLAF